MSTTPQRDHNALDIVTDIFVVKYKLEPIYTVLFQSLRGILGRVQKEDRNDSIFFPSTTGGGERNTITNN